MHITDLILKHATGLVIRTKNHGSLQSIVHCNLQQSS